MTPLRLVPLRHFLDSLRLFLVEHMNSLGLQAFELEVLQMGAVRAGKCFGAYGLRFSGRAVCEISEAFDWSVKQCIRLGIK